MPIRHAKNNTKKMRSNNLTPKETLSIIKKEFSHVDFDNTSRKKERVMLRQMYGYFAGLNQKYSLEAIGSELKMNADHSTIVHSKKTVWNYIKTKDKNAVPIYNQIKEVLKLSQKTKKTTLLKSYEYHFNQLMVIKSKIDHVTEKQKTISKIKTKEIGFNELLLLNKLIDKSVDNDDLNRDLDKWIKNKEPKYLIECTKAIGFNHKENFNTFKNLQQSIL